MEIIDVRVQGRMRVYCERRPSEAVWWQWYRESLSLASRPSPFNASWPPGILIDRATRDRTRHVHTRIRSEDLVPSTTISRGELRARACKTRGRN